MINRGSVYKEMNRTDEALKNFKDAAQVAEAIGFKEKQAAAIMAIGDIDATKKEYSKALDYYDQCLEIVKDIDDKYEAGKLYLNMGNAYLKQNELSKATSLFQKALDLGKSMDAFDLTYESLEGMASVKE